MSTETLEQYGRRLSRISRTTLVRDWMRALKSRAPKLEQSTRDYAPEQSGRLRNALRVRAEVVNGEPHLRQFTEPELPYVHLANGRHGFYERAAEQHQDEILDAVSRALIDRINGDGVG